MSRYDFNAPRLYLDAPFEIGAEILLTREQANYLCNVLRFEARSRVLVFNGRDGEWRARMEGAGKMKRLTLALEERLRQQEGGPDIQYAFAPLKHARLDYVVQKAVEMGVRRLSPLISARTQIHRINLERMRANAIEAAEQCGIMALPDIDEPQSLAQFIAQWPEGRLLVFCDENAEVANPLRALEARRQTSGVTVLIGPEGGFDDRERDLLGSIPQTCRLSLGPRILRADTAGVAALALVQATTGDWNA